MITTVIIMAERHKEAHRKIFVRSFMRTFRRNRTGIIMTRSGSQLAVSISKFE